MDETWHEVLLLICGMIDSKFTCELVEVMVFESDELQKLLFAQTCLDETNKPVESTTKGLYLKFKDFTSHENWRIRRAAVSYLAKHYKDHPETYSLLQQVIHNNEASQVRSTAVGGFAKLFSYEDTWKTGIIPIKFNDKLYLT